VLVILTTRYLWCCVVLTAATLQWKEKRPVISPHSEEADFELGTMARGATSSG
jgi:hypothetical protein